MRNTYYIVVILTIVIITIAACSKKGNTSVLLPELIQAEAIIYEHPDSALHLLQKMQIPKASHKLENATWALLMTQAKYKMFIKQNDSLANIAYTYFMKRENAQRKALVLYLKGGILHKSKKIEEAQKFFFGSRRLCRKNRRLSAMLFSQCPIR